MHFVANKFVIIKMSFLRVLVEYRQTIDLLDRHANVNLAKTLHWLLNTYGGVNIKIDPHRLLDDSFHFEFTRQFLVF